MALLNLNITIVKRMKPIAKTTRPIANKTTPKASMLSLERVADEDLM
jgi:hypothetical protein